ncbi:MAG: hypothetical protein COA67_12545 [Lutibacter sp.]|nr:MAG: hypothetical protein COA67_12545 [Lutibacter sp.]
MKTSIYKLSILLMLTITFTSCDNDNDPTNNVCENTYVTDAIVNAFSTANGYDVISTMDLETHEYVIQINADGEICTIGYQNATGYSGSYTMEVRNHNNPSVDYSGVHTFQQANLDYQPITPVPVTSGDIILVSRTISPGYANFNDVLGKVIRKTGGGNVPYGAGITQGNVKFISSDFYGAGGPVPDIAQPVIGLGFKVN